MPQKSALRSGFRRFPAVVLVLSLILPLLFALPVYSEPDTENTKTFAAIKSPDVNILTAKAGYILDNFETRSAEWTSDSGDSPEYASVLSDYPFTAYEGDYFVKLTPEEAGEQKYLKYSFQTPADLSAYTKFSFVLYCPPVDGVEYEAKIELRSGTHIYSDSSAVPSGDYYAVIFDISSFDHRENTDSITVSVCPNADPDEVILPENTDIQLDLISFYSEDIVKSISYLSDDYYLYGGTISYKNDNIILDINATGPFFELYSLDGKEFGDCNALTLKLINRTASQSVTMSYTSSGDTAFTEERSHTETIGQGENVQYVTFPIDPTNIEQIRFSFSGKINGKIELVSITPSYICAESSNSQLGKITSCLISDDLTTLTVSGTLSEYTVGFSSSYKLQLYAVPINTDDSVISSGSIDELAQIPITSEFSFEIPLEGDTNPANYLYLKFAIGINSNNRVLIIDSGKFVTNPEVFSSATESDTDLFSRGLVSPDTMLSDISAAAEEIRLDKLLDNSTSSSAKYYSLIKLSSGSSLRINFSEEYINSLDLLMAEYAAENIDVTLSLTLRKSENSALNRILIHPSALQYDTDACLAYNTQTEEGLAYLRAAAEFLAQRYGVSPTSAATGEEEDSAQAFRTECVKNIIFGSEINERIRPGSQSGYFMGEQNIYDFSADYADAFRTVYNAVRSKSGCNVFIPFGYTYDSGLSAGAKFGFDIRPLAELISSQLERGGDIEWNAAVNMRNVTDENDRNTIVNTENIETILAEFSALVSDTDNIMPSAFRYRSLLILESYRNSTAEKDESELFLDTANYIYNCLFLSQDIFYGSYLFALDSYITDRTVDENVMRYIDSQNCAEVCNEYFEKNNDYIQNGLFPFASLEAMCDESGFASGRIISRGVYSSTLLTGYPDSAVGSILLWDFTSDDNTLGWLGEENCESISSGLEMFSRPGIMKASLSIPAGEYGAVTKRFDSAYDLSKLSHLRFSLQLQLNQEITPTLWIVLYSGNSRISYSGTLPANEWTDFYIDLSEFRTTESNLPGSIQEIEKIKLVLIIPDENNAANTGLYSYEPVILIDEISGISANFTDEELQYAFNTFIPDEPITADDGPDIRIVLTLVAVIFLAATVWIVTIVSRLKYVDKNDQNG